MRLNIKFKEIDIFTAKLIGGTIVGVGIFLIVLMAFETSHGIVLTNASDDVITATHEHRSHGPKGPNHHTYLYPISPGGKEQTINLFDVWFEVNTQGTQHRYKPTEVPLAATYTISYFGLFKERLVNAAIKKDGCIYISAAGVGNSHSDVPQPKGFPLCPDIPPAAPQDEPNEPSAVWDLRAHEIEELEGQMREWTCDVPAGAERIRPLYDIGERNIANIRHVRERIELLRRRKKISWDEAASAFEVMQNKFGRDYVHPDVYKEYRLRSFAHESLNLAIYDDQKVFETYQIIEKEYKGLCAARNKGIREMLADAPALALLRKEAAKPWLHKKNRVPCALVYVRACRDANG